MWSISDVISWRLLKTAAMTLYFGLWAQAKAKIHDQETTQPYWSVWKREREREKAGLSPTKGLTLEENHVHTIIFTLHVEFARLKPCCIRWYIYCIANYINPPHPRFHLRRQGRHRSSLHPGDKGIRSAPWGCIPMYGINKVWATSNHQARWFVSSAFWVS